jgi:hypothetical protein
MRAALRGRDAVGIETSRDLPQTVPRRPFLVDATNDLWREA